MNSNDLLLFCKGDIISIMLLLRAFSNFSATSRLTTNVSKSEALNKGCYLSGILVCLSYQKSGGLGVKDAEIWNIAIVGKLVHWIYTKADRLWVQWVDHIYLKGSDWSVYDPSPDSNWNWRNIYKTRNRLAAGFVNNCWVADPKDYSVGSGYVWIQGAYPPVSWYAEVWDSWCIPKHAFIAWLVYQEALNTREKLYHLGLCDSESCVLCEAGKETHSHLFGGYPYSNQILGQIEHWLQLKFNQAGRHISQLHHHICRMAKLVCWYSIWMERNKCRLNLQLTIPARIVKDVKRLIHARVNKLIVQPVTSSDQLWFQCLDILM
ncbi:uncharacterized protein LOC141607510 [Silene latifolia]|uniref:uncharacterized protein LOC141607510 n=1 Tax=Silene latifolia TaxID=37657 RepID=UPI003D789C8F